MVFLSNLIAFRVIQLIVPDKLDAGDELLELEADVEGEGDDVVVEHHPQQQHLQDAHEGDVVHLDIVLACVNQNLYSMYLKIMAQDIFWFLFASMNRHEFEPLKGLLRQIFEFCFRC